MAAGRYPEAFFDRYDGKIPNQGLGAEMIAEQWGLDRTALDEFSLGSHEKAAAAQDSGAFDDQIVGIKDQDGNQSCSRTRASAAAPRWRRWRR